MMVVLAMVVVVVVRRSLEKLRDRLDCHIVAVEYPGYGLLKAEDPKEER